MAQTVTVEYAVTVDLDGTTPAPPIDELRLSPDDQIFRGEVESLGIIDPDLTFAGAGSFGSRFIPFLWIDTSVVGVPGARVAVLGVRADGTAALQELVEDLAGDAEVFLRRGIVVPQGSVLQIQGFTAPIGSPIHVRMTVMPIASVTEMAEVLRVLNPTP